MKYAINGKPYDPFIDGLFGGGMYAASNAGNMGIDDDGNVFARDGVSEVDKKLLKLKWNYEKEPWKRNQYAVEANVLRKRNPMFTVREDQPLSYYKVGTSDFMDKIENLASVFIDSEKPMPSQNRKKQKSRYQPVLENPDSKMEDLEHASPDYNYQYNKQYEIKGYINDQWKGEVAKMRYGNHDMSNNGCEIIAMYNALLALGNRHELRDVANWGERNGLWLDGTWGTKYWKMPNLFKELGYEVKNVHKEEDYDKELKNAKVAIFSFLNNARDPRDEIHTVTVRPLPSGRIAVFNYDPQKKGGAIYDSLEDMLQQRNKKARPLALYCVQ